MTDETQSLRRATRIYEASLRFLPHDFRQEYGPQMAQLFRDQYRDACRQANGQPLPGLWLRAFADLIRTAFLEQSSQPTKPMNHISPAKLSLILFAVGVGAAISSCFVPGHSGIALVLIYCSSLALVLRAAAEWKRPPEDLVRSLAWGAAIAVIYGLIIPQWAKQQLIVAPGAQSTELSRLLVLIPMLLNALPFLIKAGWRAARPRV